jgi:hypothetical protein
VDITELILNQHHEQRRTFALLDELADDPAGLAAVWERLTILLEVHAKAEELFFYPRLLEVGTGGGDADSVESETKDAIKDHNEIRDAIAEAARHAVGSEAWWKAVRDCDEANSDHMAEEEREDLVDFRQHDPARDRRPVHRLREPARRAGHHPAGQGPGRLRGREQLRLPTRALGSRACGTGRRSPTPWTCTARRWRTRCWGTGRSTSL